MTEKARQLGSESISPCRDTDKYGVDRFKPEWGLNKREYFAGLAMQGLIDMHDSSRNKGAKYIKPDILSVIAVEYADALLEELSKDNSVELPKPIKAGSGRSPEQADEYFPF